MQLVEDFYRKMGLDHSFDSDSSLGSIFCNNPLVLFFFYGCQPKGKRKILRSWSKRRSGSDKKIKYHTSESSLKIKNNIISRWVSKSYLFLVYFMFYTKCIGLMWKCFINEIYLITLIRPCAKSLFVLL